MTKKEIKRRIEDSFSLANILNTAMAGHMDSFRIVSTQLKDGGQVVYFYNLKENRLEFHMKNTDEHQGITMQSKDVPETLSEILSRMTLWFKNMSGSEIEF